MAQRIILIHGRSTKPAKAVYAKLQKKALVQGLSKISKAKAKKVDDGDIPIDFVYYGDINNDILAADSAKVRKQLTANDPHCDGAACLPATGISEAIDTLGDFPHDARNYKRIVRDNDDLRFLDDAARAVSTLASLVTGGAANMAAIKYATADMGAYLTTRAVGSEVRNRLQDPLRTALKRGDDIHLISHSMGCMVAYDVLWKFSRMSEYQDLRMTGNRIQWLTLGCPLGEAGVKANLYDAGEFDHRLGTDKYPSKIVKDWVNIAAKDDFISHDRTMKGDYKAMLKFDLVDSISDRMIYNCYVHDETSNPHKLYGYLANSVGMKSVADWIK